MPKKNGSSSFFGKYKIPGAISTLLLVIVLAFLVLTEQMDLGQALQIFMNQPTETVSLPLGPTEAEPTASRQLTATREAPARTATPKTTAPVAKTIAPAAKTTAPAAKSTLPPGVKADFDFYVLALSWSPDYCASSGGDDPQQCSIGKKLGFVLHGLWPNYTRGYPSNCSTQKLPAAVKARFPNLYPSDSLYTHEWEKHGTCSGLEPEAYLNLSKNLKESVQIPDAYRSPEQTLRITVDQLKKDVVAANPEIRADGLAVNCSGNGKYLTELYVCFSPSGQPTACSDEVARSAAKSCQNPEFLIRNVR